MYIYILDLYERFMSDASKSQPEMEVCRTVSVVKINY